MCLWWIGSTKSHTTWFKSLSIIYNCHYIKWKNEKKTINSYNYNNPVTKQTKHLPSKNVAYFCDILLVFSKILKQKLTWWTSLVQHVDRFCHQSTQRGLQSQTWCDRCVRPCFDCAFDGTTRAKTCAASDCVTTSTRSARSLLNSQWTMNSSQCNHTSTG